MNQNRAILNANSWGSFVCLFLFFASLGILWKHSLLRVKTSCEAFLIAMCPAHSRIMVGRMFLNEVNTFKAHDFVFLLQLKEASAYLSVCSLWPFVGFYWHPLSLFLHPLTVLLVICPPAIEGNWLSCNWEAGPPYTRGTNTLFPF